jgi:hypothetical protein
MRPSDFESAPLWPLRYLSRSARYISRALFYQYCASALAVAMTAWPSARPALLAGTCRWMNTLMPADSRRCYTCSSKPRFPKNRRSSTRASHSIAAGLPIRTTASSMWHLRGGAFRKGNLGAPAAAIGLGSMATPCPAKRRDKTRMIPRSGISNQRRFAP